MLVVPSTLQLLLAIVLVLFGVCGNLAILFFSYCTTLRCPHITFLVVLDFIVTMLGPGHILLTIVIGPTWLGHNKTFCQSLSFLSSWALITYFLVLFFLAVFSHKGQHHVPFPEKRKRKRCDFLAMRLLICSLLVVDILLGWSVFNDLHLAPSCNLLIHVQFVSKNSVFYLAASFICLSTTIFLAARGMRTKCRLYPVQLFCERHKYEVKINDPEMTTVASISSSNQSHATITSNRSYWSRRSSGWRSGMLSVTASPLVSRKVSQQSRLQDNAASLDRQALLNVALLSLSERGTGEDARKKLSDMTHPAVAALQKNAERKPRSPSSRQEPFVISSGIPFIFPILPVGRRVFKNPRFLPQFKGLEHHRSLSRLLLLKSCFTGLCWLPLYVAVALQLSSVKYPQELHFFIHWLIFLPFSISPLFSLCGANISRRILRRAACYVLKICACGLHKVQFQTAKSEARQVRLLYVRPLQTETL